MPAKTLPVRHSLNSKVSLDSIMRVDRSIRPAYPKWVQRVMRIDLECTGPTRYDLASVKLWLHEGQRRDDGIKGCEIQRYLVATNSLKTCLGLRDAEEIRKKGIRSFREFFRGKTLFFWRSVVRRDDGRLSVPYLYEYHGDEVALDFLWLEDDWTCTAPAARFSL